MNILYVLYCCSFLIIHIAVVVVIIIVIVVTTFIIIRFCKYKFRTLFHSSLFW